MQNPRLVPVSFSLLLSLDELGFTALIAKHKVDDDWIFYPSKKDVGIIMQEYFDSGNRNVCIIMIRRQIELPSRLEGFCAFDDPLN